MYTSPVQGLLRRRLTCTVRRTVLMQTEVPNSLDALGLPARVTRCKAYRTGTVILNRRCHCQHVALRHHDVRGLVATLAGNVVRQHTNPDSHIYIAPVPMPAPFNPPLASTSAWLPVHVMLLPMLSAEPAAPSNRLVDVEMPGSVAPRHEHSFILCVHVARTDNHATSSGNMCGQIALFPKF